MIPILLNLIAGAAALSAVAIMIRRHSLRAVMKYFTAESNVFCAFACLTVAACRIAGGAPTGVLIWKYVGTQAVTVTLLTVIFFLVPQYGAKALFAGPDLWLHLLCPLLALITYFGWDKPAMPFSCVFLGILPVALYAVLYLRMVIFAPPDKRWEDFYGFNKGGKWPVSFAVMILAAFLISVLLWAL